MKKGDLLARFGKDFAGGTVLFSEGDVGREMYVINSGKIQISRNIQGCKTVLAILPPGEFFGEMALLNNQPRSATALVLEPARLLVIDSATFHQMIQSSSEIAIRMIQKLSERLAMANSQIEILLVRDANHRVVFTLRRMAEMQGRPAGVGVLVPATLSELAGRTALTEDEVATILKRLQKARLVKVLPQGYVIPEVGRLHDYLDFLEMGRKFGSQSTPKPPAKRPSSPSPESDPT
jgi:CRP-like cAMP-binding protein